MTIDLAKLAAPFPPERVSWRVGSTTADKKRGMALAYIDARDVQDRLDAVCGPANWQNRYPHANGKTVCEIGIRINGEWVWKADGAGDSDIEAEKGALSDAFKRAAVKWGIGRYLYDLESPWVDLEGKQIAKHELPKLRALLAGKAKPAQESDDAEVQRLRDCYGRIRRDITDADSAKKLREVIKAHAGDLATLKAKRPGAYDGLMALVTYRTQALTQAELIGA